MMMPFTPIMSGFGFFGFIFVIAFWGLVIWGILYLIRGVSARDGSSLPHNNALEILKERYVKSEIDKKEFEEKKKTLTN